MGMCKGCGQIFKTEDMKYNFCIDCQESNEDKIKEINLIVSGLAARTNTGRHRSNGVPQGPKVFRPSLKASVLSGNAFNEDEEA